MNDEIVCLFDEYKNKYYVIENKRFNLLNNNMEWRDRIIKHNLVTYFDKKLIHREDGPAIEYVNGTKEWYKKGLCHREDGPAIEDCFGDKCWYINGNLNRENGPAIEYKDGSKEWYKNGMLHRLDGPALELNSGYKEYWINDNKISEEKFYLEKELRESIINNNIIKKNKI